MSSKLDLIKKLTAQSDIWTVEDAMQQWWQNPNGGWRLTYDGFKAFEHYNLEHWDFVVPVAATPGTLLTLDRKLDCPYYIQFGKQPKLIVFGSKQAVMLAMYNDLEKFLKYLARQWIMFYTLLGRMVEVIIFQ